MTTELTIENQRLKEFAEQLGNGELPDIAAKRAKIPLDSQGAVAVVMDPNAQKYVLRKVMARVKMLQAPQAWRFIGEVMRDESAPLKSRLWCAGKIIEVAGYVAPKAGENEASAPEKSTEDMTPEELREYIARAEAELANRAIPIPASPDNPLNELW